MENKGREVRHAGGPDRISELPDNILHHILSLIDIKQAVQTSVLSKKWRYLWTSLRDLNFDRQSFNPSTSFENFVGMVLKYRECDSTVGKFRVSSPSKSTSHHFTRGVIDYAISHNVDHLMVDVCDQSYDLPPELLSCQSLKTVELTGFTLPKSCSFTTLSTLSLDHCKISSDDPFASCCNLNNLWLLGCDFRGFKVLKISGPQLVNLSVISMGYPWELSKGCKVEISAPKLKFFSYKLSEAVDFSLINFPCLVYAEVVHIAIPYKAHLNLFKLLQGLHNAQFVTLDFSVIKALTMVPDMLELQLSPFSSLKSLKLHPNCDASMIPVKVKTYLLSGSLSAEIVSSNSWR